MELEAWYHLHDWEIVSTLSEPRERRLTLELTLPSSDGTARHATLVFEGVVRHFLERENHQNVIFSLDEIGLDNVIGSYRWVFERDRGYGWPVAGDGDAAVIRELERLGVRAWCISTSYGLEGFVLAHSARIMDAKSRG